MDRRCTVSHVGCAIARDACAARLVGVSGTEFADLCEDWRKAGSLVFQLGCGEPDCGGGGASVVSSAIFFCADEVGGWRRRDSLCFTTNGPARQWRESRGEIQSRGRAVRGATGNVRILSDRALLLVCAAARWDLTTRRDSPRALDTRESAGYDFTKYDDQVA